MRYLIFILVLASIAYSQSPPPIEPGVSQDLAKWRAARYSDVRYKLNLTLEKMSPVLKGTIEIRVNVSEPGAIATGFLPQIVLDWRKIGGHEKDSTISNVSINGRNLKGTVVEGFDVRIGEKDSVYMEDYDHLIFRDGVVPGENVIKLDFTSPILTSGSAITRYIDKEDGSEYIYSLFVPSDASTAFPCFDQPDLKAKFKLEVVFPIDWKVVTNVLEGLYDLRQYDPFTHQETSPGKAFSLTAYKETKPISTYVFAFAAGPFKQFQYISGDVMKSADETYFKRPRDPNSFTMNVFVRQSQAAKFQPHAKEVYRLTQEGINYLETYFDYKFPFPKYDLVLIPEFPFGGMEHAGATFLREDRIIFPQEPTKNDYITRANVIFHETAHQWFGDTVTMKWFDDLWLKEGFAEFMAYKTMEKVMPEYNAWKVFYERNKQAAYLTDSTKGTTPIYQPIANLSAAKSAYGNIVYRKAPSFLRQAEFYLGEDKFQTAVRAFLKKHEFANAGWEDLVKEFEGASGNDLKGWADKWIRSRGVVKIRTSFSELIDENGIGHGGFSIDAKSSTDFPEADGLQMGYQSLIQNVDGTTAVLNIQGTPPNEKTAFQFGEMVNKKPVAVFPNYQDYGYGIFLLDDKSREYVLKNIQNEKDDFLRSMMWGSLWDSVREAELDPKDYVELVIKVLSSNFSLPPAGKKPAKAGTQNATKNAGSQNPGETDETTIATLLSHVSTAMNYYMPVPPAVDRGGTDVQTRLEDLLLDKLQHAATPGQRITYYRAYVGIASTPKAHEVLKQMLASAGGPALRTKDKFEIVTRLIVLGDPEAPKLLANFEKTETSDDAKRYAYAARAAFATAENKAKVWTDFVNNKDISESWIESAIIPFNSIRQSDLTLPYLERSLAELPNLKRSRKIFFVNNWLSAFISGHRSEEALAIVNKFLASNPNLDNDLRLKILENVDLIERAVRIRAKFAK